MIGGGLAGSEAAWQAAERGARVRLFEMRPTLPTAAHQTGNLGEIVCSNSLKSDQPGSAPYLLKEELRRGGSLLIEVAHKTAVPAGAALAVDRERFAKSNPAYRGASKHKVTRDEVKSFPARRPVIIASGPLTSPALSEQIASSPLFSFVLLRRDIAGRRSGYHRSDRVSRSSLRQGRS